VLFSGYIESAEQSRTAEQNKMTVKQDRTRLASTEYDLSRQNMTCIGRTRLVPREQISSRSGRIRNQKGSAVLLTLPIQCTPFLGAVELWVVKKLVLSFNFLAFLSNVALFAYSVF